MKIINDLVKIFQISKMINKLVLKLIFLILYILTLLNEKYLKNNFKNSFKGIAICAIAKNENLYINEFINYYKNLGINKVYLYDNNDIFGENFTFILKDDIKSNFVEVINIRGKTEYQIKAYNECYRNHIDDYSWFLIVDVDEYLYIKNNVSLYNYLNNPKFKKCNNIHINHKMYGDSDLLNYDNRTLFQRFTKNFIYMKFMKTIVRGGLKNANMHLHRSFNISKYCDSEGNYLTPVAGAKGVYSTKKLCKNKAEIRHYITKSVEEFYIRLLRGWPDMKKGSKRYNEFVARRIKMFFRINKITKKKLDIISPLIKQKKLLKKLFEKLNKTNKIL